MTKKSLKILMLTLIFSNTYEAQTTHDKGLNLALTTQGKISDHFSLSNSVLYVSRTFFIIESSGNYHQKISDNTNAMFSLGYSNGWIISANDLDAYRNEARPWIQAGLTKNFKKATLQNRFRTEARFLEGLSNHEATGKYNFNWRFRYMVQGKYFLEKNKEKNTDQFIFASEEVLLNAGKIIKNNFRINQNRFSAGFGCRKNNTTYQMGYNNFIKFDAKIDGKKTMQHNVFFSINYNFDFRKL